MNYCFIYLKRKFTWIIVLFAIAAFSISPALAYSDGPNNAGAGTNISTIGTELWTTPEEITTPGSPYAAALLYHLHTYSNYLVGTQYGFNIPAEAVIAGIEVSINRMASGRNPSLLDNVVSLVSAGNLVGENRAMPDPWPVTLEVVTYGGPTDLWGSSWTPADINSTGFGAALAVVRNNNGNNNRTAFVDSMQITIYYAYASTTTVECGAGLPVTYGESVVCVATVTRGGSSLTPTGSVDWSSDAAGTFDPIQCVLEGTDGVATCSTTYTPAEVGDGTQLVTADYGGDDYFVPSDGDDPVNVVPRPITVTADPQEKVYNDPDPEFTYQVTSGSLVFNDDFTGALTREPGEDAGTYDIFQGSLALSDNYLLSYTGNTLTILKADAVCLVEPYDVAYDSLEHTASGACTGVVGENLPGLDLGGTTHTNAGAYPGDPWIFTDVTGNYLDQSGTVDDNISPVAPVCEVLPYTLEYDREPHTATGTCTGVIGETLAGLDLSGTTHTEVGLYPQDPWVFVDVSGNYTDLNGSVDDEITLRMITVAADAKSKVRGQADPELTYQVTGGFLLSGDVFSGALVREPGERIGVYAILQGNLSLPDYYQLVYSGADFSITGVRYMLPLVMR